MNSKSRCFKQVLLIGTLILGTETVSCYNDEQKTEFLVIEKPPYTIPTHGPHSEQNNDFEIRFTGVAGLTSITSISGTPLQNI